MNSYQIYKYKYLTELNKIQSFQVKNSNDLITGAKKLGCDIDDIIRVDDGTYIRKSDFQKYYEIHARMGKEFYELIDADTDGDGFIYEMFKEELKKPYDLNQIQCMLNLTEDELDSKENVKKALNKVINNK